MWQYCRDEPAVNNDGEIVFFTADNAETSSLEIKEKITGKRGFNYLDTLIVPLFQHAFVVLSRKNMLK